MTFIIIKNNVNLNILDKRKFNFLAIGKRTTSTKEMLLTQAFLVVYLPKMDL